MKRDPIAPPRRKRRRSPRRGAGVCAGPARADAGVPVQLLPGRRCRSRLIWPARPHVGCRCGRAGTRTC